MKEDKPIASNGGITSSTSSTKTNISTAKTATSTTIQGINQKGVAEIKKAINSYLSAMRTLGDNVYEEFAGTTQWSQIM